jgi:hypothetical protein
VLLDQRAAVQSAVSKTIAFAMHILQGACGTSLQVLVAETNTSSIDR